MVLLEISVVPLGEGESLGEHVAQCVEVVEKSGLDYQLHSMGTIVEGELDQVLQLMKTCIETVASKSDRVTCTARIDYRKGASGQIREKVASVEKQLGRQLKTSV